MDTTYFGRKYGIMVFRSYELKKNLYWKEISRETKQAYIDGIKELQFQWWKIRAIVCDWKRWLLWWFREIPVQMCLFHQQQIIRRYITKNPKLKANIELKEITSILGKIKEENMKLLLEDWDRKYKDFLREKNESWKYVHDRTRKAYRSLKDNLRYCYTFKRYEGEIEIPSTTNSLESTFGHMKQKVWLHRWLKKQRKLKLIDYFLQK